MSIHYEKKICSEVVFKGKIVNIHHDRVELENGKLALREVISYPGAVAVLALKNKKLLLVRQYRHAVERELLEIPAGKLEIGELPLSAAARELEEETGASCGELIYLGDYYSSPGVFSEAIHIYFAEVTASIEAHPDTDEFVTSLEIEISDFAAMLANGEVNDGKTVFAFALAAAKGFLKDYR